MKSTILTSPLTTAQLAEMIGRTEQQMICEGFDLDLFDTARWLIGNKVDLDNRDDAAVAPRPTAEPRGFLDAAVILARSCTLTSSP
jgi:hypothetical protein